MNVKNVRFGDSTGIVSGGNLRLVTERERKPYPKVVCTEPSPDYAVAFDRNRTLKITPPEGSGRKVELDAGSSEFVLKGDGRSEGVMALRDGLYTACQSYANGVIGQDAYAIILSQYGNLLVALVGNDEAAKGIQVSGPQAALSAMTVACISGYDRTRSVNHSNDLLTQPFCARLLKDVANRALSQSPKPPGPKAAGNTSDKKPDKVVQQGGSSVTTTTTTNTVVK